MYASVATGMQKTPKKMSHFRVEAALTGDDPHRSVRDPFVIRFLGSQNQPAAPAYDSVPDKRLYHFCNLGFGQLPDRKELLEFIPVDKTFV